MHGACAKIDDPVVVDCQFVPGDAVTVNESPRTIALPRADGSAIGVTSAPLRYGFAAPVYYRDVHNAGCIFGSKWFVVDRLWRRFIVGGG